MQGRIELLAKSKNSTAGFSSEKIARNVVRVKVPFKESQEWEWKCLLRSDAHHDNPHCIQSLERAHLEEAINYGAGIVDAGDLFCAMQGKYDKRSSKSDIRPEHLNGNYLDSLVSTAADFYEPYSRNFISIAHGNHETAIKKRHETDLTERLVSCLNDRTGSSINNGGYSGFIQYVFTSRYNKSNGTTRVINLFYYHGHGGGGPVTKGVIQTNRRATYLPDANIVLTGHVHEQWVLTIPRVRINRYGKVYHEDQVHVCAPTYKEEYEDGYGGWHVETGKPPKPLGAWWLCFFWNSRKKSIDFNLVHAK